MKGEIPYSLRHVLIEDIRAGQFITQCFLVKQKTTRSTKRGDPYLELQLADQSGYLSARAWAETTNRYGNQFNEGDFVFLEGRTEMYHDTLQLVVSSIQNLDQYQRENGKIPGFDHSFLVPTSRYDVEEMWQEVLTMVNDEIKSPQVRELMHAVLSKYEVQYKEFPAAIEYHHAYLGGLLEHSLEVARAVLSFAKVHSGIDIDIALAGALLHDIGKILEFNDSVATSHSFSGQLVGHLLLGCNMIHEKAMTIDWSDNRIPKLIEHIILSHHGELEYGAVVVPKTKEAIVVYHFDDLSAKLNMIDKHIAADSTEQEFTGWHHLLTRKFFKGRAKTDPK
jgi:3'-5' exoribonuclease